NPAPKLRCHASRTRAVLFVRRSESVLWRIELFLTEQIRDREPLRWSLESGDKFLETLREEIVASLPVKFQSWGRKIMFVKIGPTTPNRFIHQSVDVVEMNCLHRFQKLESEMKKPRLVFAGKRI